MKYIIAIFLIPLMLMGCQSTSSFKNSSDSDIPVASESDEYYLKVAKDLYITKQYRQTYQIVSNLAEKNNVEAQYLSGYLLYYGQGISADTEQGTKWIEVSADAGYRPAIEALVMIRHGLTPDNECPSAVSIPDITNQAQAATMMKPEDGEVLIAPEQGQENKNLEQKDSTQKVKTDQNIPVNTEIPDRLWNRYTIQLLNAHSEGFIRKYVQAFKKRYPDLNKFIITYKSKSKPNSYGVGFNAFESTKDANKTLEELKLKLNDTTLWIKPLKNSIPLSI